MNKSSMHIIFGPIGAGKSTFAQQLAKQHNAMIFSIDEWFKTLYFDDMNGMPDLSWTFERVARCEHQIWSVAKQSIGLGHNVIFDLGLLKIADRERINTLCEEMNVEKHFYFLTTDLATRQSRVTKRNTETGGTFSFSVSPKMFEVANGMFEEPNDAELIYTRVVDTNVPRTSP
ncbi:ATP-binding protein [Vibrio sp. DW001]|uniref:AAA family ATPase n=1 Tax=Vibrio sp. DW001 TaxID=2912315 RepID=UPI0023B0E97B|nr:ATP-binding protein [Vibrio sp. DW001]WED25469.1 ATP-binding protein [Vibrio sp. DW001]